MVRMSPVTSIAETRYEPRASVTLTDDGLRIECDLDRVHPDDYAKVSNEALGWFTLGLLLVRRCPRCGEECTDAGTDPATGNEWMQCPVIVKDEWAMRQDRFAQFRTPKLMSAHGLWLLLPDLSYRWARTWDDRG